MCEKLCLALVLLGLLAGCQSEPTEVVSFKQTVTATKTVASHPYTSGKIICYIPEYCYQIAGLDGHHARIKHAPWIGKLFISFSINSTLQISREKIQKVYLSDRKFGKQVFADASTLTPIQLQNLLALVRPALQ
jgi:uncharacterized protein YcfL